MASAARTRSYGLRTALIAALAAVALTSTPAAHAGDARFDLTGPRIDVRVTRLNAAGTPVSLPVASVPNLRPGDRIWLHPDLPSTQSVRYLLICVFLRGTTNPPPDDWFIRIETWNRSVREEGTSVTVPEGAEQAVLFLAPETGGDFSTLKSAVRGRPGAFVRASQDLTEASFEQARIEKYLASIRRVPASDAASLEKHSDLLARTLALKPNQDCFKRPIDMQFTCLTQSGSQIVLDDGHGQSIVSELSTGPGSDFISAASSTQLAGGGMYSAYVGAVVDMVRILGNIHTAQYQYIPAISFPQGDALNLRLNTPPSFHNPKSVLVIALPAVQPAIPPPLRLAFPDEVTCLLQPAPALPIEGAPLVFSTDFAHDLVLHLNTPPGAPAEPDIPLVPDAFSGGLVLLSTPQHHTPLLDAEPQPLRDVASSSTLASTANSKTNKTTNAKPEPVLLSGTIQGEWGFDDFIGPTVPLQQLPGTGWHLVPAPEASSGNSDATELIAGKAATLYLRSSGTACVHTITAHPAGSATSLTLHFKPLSPPSHADHPATVNLQPRTLAVSIPTGQATTPGNLHLEIQQYQQPSTDVIATRTYAEPAQLAAIELHAGDRSLELTGSRLGEVASLTLGDLTFQPGPEDGNTSPAGAGTLRLTLPTAAAAPNTHIDEHLTAVVHLRDGRTLTLPVTVSAPRPALTLLRRSISSPPSSLIHLANPDDLPLRSQLTFTLKSATPFPRNGQIEIETLDGTLRTVLTLAPSGGLLMQDPHTVVATLDPLSSFGPSAFGPLHVRALFPPQPPHHHEPASEWENEPGKHPETEAHAPVPTLSDWIPLVILVRLPTLTQLQCPQDDTDSCTLTGAELFLLQSLSTDPGYANPVEVPDGFTGTSLTLPHPSAQTVFFKLRDDPTPINSVVFPPPPVVKTSHPRHSTRPAAPATPPTPPAEPSTAPATAPLATEPTPAPATTPPPAPAPQQKSPAASPGFSATKPAPAPAATPE